MNLSLAIKNIVGTSVVYFFLIVPFDPQLLLAVVIIFFLISICKGIPVDKISLAFLLSLLVCIYGVFVGFFNGNPTAHIFRNAGGAFFLLTYFIFSSFSNEWLRVINFFIIRALIAYLFFSIIFYIAYNIGLRELFYNFIFILGDVHGSGDDSIYRTYGFPFFSLGLLALPLIVGNRSDYFHVSIGFLILIFIIVSSFSKGAVLMFFFSLVIYLHVGKNSLLTKIFVIVFAFILGYFAYSTYLENVINVFGVESTGNLQRIEQLKSFFDEVTLLGNGFGAPFKTFIRSFDAPYGSEISYFMFIHKVGIFSLIVFFLLFFGLFSIFTVPKYRMSAELIQLAGISLYLFPSFGNPILFHPILLTLFCFYFAAYRRSMFGRCVSGGQ
ncbi:MAG: hypothetical protein A0129_15055 [Limnobacter sp. CACIAM 66H1]|uniref:hypothetical protein n=1 Tax=Limnobacter sp. CACIAM 66H1 TaxID=1813033 RepID=UPI0007A7F268|nr:hypothetical protein [Limnobacter sp. CACIAM 66H1]KYP10053.1 MAG: hypothetical protein A0129_15055 [Limnobacter sp. CACIAM 66H1]